MFEGTHRDGAWHDGRLTFPDGTMYTGGFKGSAFHGTGALHTRAGRAYEGGWNNGAPHGEGRERAASDAPWQSGRWERGLKVGRDEHLREEFEEEVRKRKVEHRDKLREQGGQHDAEGEAARRKQPPKAAAATVASEPGPEPEPDANKPDEWGDSAGEAEEHAWDEEL
eukprot:g2806.t1